MRQRWLRLQTRLLQLQYRHRPYSEYYTAVMRLRTAYDPKFAVGGLWDEIGQLQFDFLCANGLEVQHKLLDFGCGSLRGGLRFIEYLAEGNYTGVDISAEALDAGRVFLGEAGLEEKKPILRLSGGLSFDDFAGETFDFIIAQSVLTHMPPENIEIILVNVHKVMHAESVLFATFFDGGDRMYHTHERTNFYYPFGMFREFGEKHDLEVRCEDGYEHPRGQKMMRIGLAGAKSITS